MKKSIKIVLLCVLGLVIVIGVCVWLQLGSLVQGAMSCEKLDDGIYYMEYKGDDGFKELMARGGCNDVSVLASYVMEFLSKGYFKPDSLDVPVKPVGCSTLTVKTPEGGVMMARNFDNPYGTALIMHTIPDEGYESITTFSTDFFGFGGEDYKPEGFRNQYMALTGLFLALDGLNEKGLAIAVLDAGDKVVTRQNTSKPDLTTTTAVQYLLKNAANIDEALVLLRSIDMNSDPGSAYHLSMADATGRSVAVNNALMERMKSWAAKRGLLTEDAVIYAIALDNPQSVAPEMCRYDICLHTPNIKNVETDNQVKRRVITSGKYVVFKIEHTAKAVADFWTSFPTDMAKSEYKMDFSRPIMERYSIVMVKHGCCEMCVPILC